MNSPGSSSHRPAVSWRARSRARVRYARAGPTGSRVFLGVTLVGATWVRARSREVGRLEKRAFRVVNDAPNALRAPVWLVMQGGSLAAVGASALAALRFDRRTALVTAGAGSVVWGGVKLVKPAIGRGRPEHHLPDVRVRGAAQSGLGYPSGHAAVATTLAVITTGRSSPLIHRAALSVAATVGLARMYVGAHLPFDVVGGMGIGLVAGSAGAEVIARGADGRPGGR